MQYLQLRVRYITLFIIIFCLLVSAGPVLAILPVNGQGLSQKELARLDKFFRWEMFKKDKTLVMYHKSMYRILSEKRLKDDTRDCNDLDCARKLGQELSVKYVAQSNVAKSENSIVFFLRVIDIKDNRVIMTAEEYVNTGYIETLIVRHFPMVVQRMAESCKRSKPKE